MNAKMIFKIAGKVNTLMEQVEDLDDFEFMTLMCGMFDAYYHKHRESKTPEEMSRIVADQVEAVNRECGRY